MKVTVAKSDEWIAKAASFKDTIAEATINPDWGSQAPIVIEFAAKLYAMILSCTKDDAFRICHSVKDGDGLEAMR